MKRVCLYILYAACFCLQAALLIWFLPCIIEEMLTGKWQRRFWFTVKRPEDPYKYAFEDWRYKDDQTRAERVWEKGKTFYSQSPKAAQRMTWSTWLRKENETRAKRVFENRNNFYKESKK